MGKPRKRDRGSKRKDLLRLREVMSILIEPFYEMEHMTDDMKLEAAFRASDFPIYKRKILSTMPVEGLWWLEQSQWLRFAWAGRKSTIIKTDQDSDRVFTTMSYNNKGFCYIRELQDRVDLEGMVRTTKWDKEKKKRKGFACEWITVSVSKEEYQRLEKYLGPKEETCRHD